MSDSDRDGQIIELREFDDVRARYGLETGYYRIEKVEKDVSFATHTDRENPNLRDPEHGKASPIDAETWGGSDG